MILYAKIINEQTKEVQVGIGEDSVYFASLGMTEMDVEKADDGAWYLVGYAPEAPKPTIEERVLQLESEYGMNRWQREGILAEGSLYSDFTKAKAQELEDLAKELRG